MSDGGSDEARQRRAVTDGGWPTAKGVPTRTGYGGGGGPETEPKKPPWTADAIHEAPPAVAHGAVFTATKSESVRAYDIESGEQLWECDIEGRLQDTNVVAADGMVFGGDKDGVIFGIDAETGELAWTFEPEDDRMLEVNAEPTVEDGTVYATVRGNGMLYALDAATGEKEWEFDCDGRYVECTPVVHDGWIYLGDGDGNFYGINPEFEIDEWKFDEYHPDFRYAPAAADGRIFANADDDLYAFDAESGEERWSSYNSHYGAPTVVDGVVYAGTGDGITAYDAESGEELTTYETDSRKNFSPTYADGILYVGTSDDTVEAFDADSGAHLWSYDMDDTVQSGVVVADGAVFAVRGSYGDDLLALTEGADDIEADATVAELDIRGAESEADTDDTADAGDAADAGEAADAADADDTPAITGPKTADGEWATAHGVPTRTGYVGGGRPEAEPKKPPWKADAIHEAPPAVAHGAVFTATKDGTVRAYDIETGEPFWECEIEGRLQDTNVVAADGMVFGGDKDGVIFGIDAETGELAWTFEPEDDRMLEVNAEPTVHDGTVYATVRGNGMLYALDAETGEKQWAFECDGRYVECTPVVHDGWIYLGDGDGNFYGVNPEFEVDEWKFDEYHPDFRYAPAAAGGIVVANADDDLYAFDAESGEELWSSYNSHYGAPTIVDGIVYAGTGDGITGYDAETGEEVVTYGTDSRKNFSPTYADGVLYVGTSDDTVEAFDADSGAHLWTYDMDDTVQSGVVVADGAVFAVRGSYGDDLLALTEGADDIEADASVGAFDARSGESIDVGGDETPQTEFFDIATEQVDDPDSPTDEELQAIILGSICDEWVTGTRAVKLNSNAIEEEIAEQVAGATEGLVHHNLQRLAEKGYVGWENKNQYHLVTSRPEAIHLYEELTDERVIKVHDLMEVLEPLYEQTRHHPRDPALTREHLQDETYLDDDKLDRIIWYLDNLGKWIEDVLLVTGAVGHVNTRAMASGTFWHEAELNGSGKELYEELSE